MHPEKRVALNCDRCMERGEGPICVEYCPMNALSCSTMQRPRSPRKPLGRRGVSG
jgi:Fe-S-cluster-containing hydrogenase component 2